MLITKIAYPNPLSNYRHALIITPSCQVNLYSSVTYPHTDSVVEIETGVGEGVYRATVTNFNLLYFSDGNNSKNTKEGTCSLCSANRWKINFCDFCTSYMTYRIWQNCYSLVAYQSHTICFCIVITGTGKTLAYLAPLVHHLREDERTHGVITRPKRPRACIVVPGRELGVQVLVSDISVFVERGFVTSLIYGVRMGLEILESLEILSFSRTETDLGKWVIF